MYSSVVMCLAPEGSVVVHDFHAVGTHLALQAGERLEQPAAQGGMGYTPRRGADLFPRLFDYPQTLYPVAADFARLQALVLAADPTGSTLGLGRGRIKVAMGGQTYTLKPDMALVPLPAQHVGKAAWLEG